MIPETIKMYFEDSIKDFLKNDIYEKNDNYYSKLGKVEEMIINGEITKIDLSNLFNEILDRN
jgi:hypothetical protein